MVEFIGGSSGRVPARIVGVTRIHGCHAKFDLHSSCPLAGGLGLCEYVQHIAMIDAVCVSGIVDDRTTEYAAHLHEHFRDPAQIRAGHYVVPHAPGYSIEMLTDSIAALTYPTGSEWA